MLLDGGNGDRASVRGGGAGTISDAEVSCPSPIEEGWHRCVRADPHPTSLARRFYLEVRPHPQRLFCAPWAQEGGGAARSDRQIGAQPNKSRQIGAPTNGTAKNPNDSSAACGRGRAVKLPETIAMAAHRRDISVDPRRLPK